MNNWYSNHRKFFKSLTRQLLIFCIIIIFIGGIFDFAQKNYVLVTWKYLLLLWMVMSMGKDDLLENYHNLTGEMSDFIEKNICIFESQARLIKELMTKLTEEEKEELFKKYQENPDNTFKLRKEVKKT